MMWRRRPTTKVEFDEILLDASNLPAFNQDRLEGKFELPLTKRNIRIVGFLFTLIALLFWWQLYQLQVVNGAQYSEISQNNRLDDATIIAERGVVYDRAGELVAWNEYDYSEVYPFPVRAYTDQIGIGQIIGYVSYPQKDSQGFYYQTEYVGRNGLEEAFNDVLAGVNGRQIVERDARGDIVTAHAISEPTPGAPVTLSLDLALSAAMHDIIATNTEKAGFRSGAGAIMDVQTGEIIAMTSFPSYDPEVMSDGDDVELIASYNEDERTPFLNKVVGGTYTPGSIVKPFVAYGALAEDIIDPDKIIVSNGELVVPNPYHPSNPTIFTDWRAHGKMNMQEAIAFSSNVYFYIIGGGFDEQDGLGITKLNQYFRLFGLGSSTGIRLNNEQDGTVPTPEWKQAVFDDDWRLGDTYLTSIGQFGFQTTPIQMLRAYGALANGGKLFTPHFEQGVVGSYDEIDLQQQHLDIVHEGMRMTVTYPGGTARSLERSDVAIAAKSGTAELGAGNAYVNSWAAGFFPYEEPKYAFILLMERAPRSNTIGATRVMGEVVEWMSTNTPEYLGIDDTEPAL